MTPTATAGGPSRFTLATAGSPFDTSAGQVWLMRMALTGNHHEQIQNMFMTLTFFLATREDRKDETK